MLEAALVYAEMGFRVHPLEPNGKKPILKEWQNKASVDELQVHQWWKQWPDANIGLATGGGSGVCVFDIDGEEGERSWTQLVSEVPEIPEDTLESKTARGRHLFCKYPSSREIRNKQSIRPGLDIRGEGGYVVVPPSVHPNGSAYLWPEGLDQEIAVFPDRFFDVLSSPNGNKTARRPWAPLSAPKEVVPDPPERVSVVDRARLYLDEVPPAVQGDGGHDSLLWAARVLVVGFELSLVDARQLLEEYNLKCVPPWNLEDPAEAKDFYRKLDEAHSTYSEKEPGWLLDEFGLKSSEAKTSALGVAWAKALVENELKKKTCSVAIPPEKPDAPMSEFKPFPTHAFPPRFAEFIQKAACAYGVNECVFAMSMLVTAGSAMGNAFRIYLKNNYEPPPILWFGYLADSGQNKTAPLFAIVKSLKSVIPANQIPNNTLVSVHRMVVSNATVEAVLERLTRWPRGAMCFRNEMVGWLKSFDVYKGGKGGDEQDWLEFWDGKDYIMDRKTNNEEIRIPAAAVSFIGGIQPDLLPGCFTPDRLASGLIPRILVAQPPGQDMYWSDKEVSDIDMKFWNDAIRALRVYPYAALDTIANQFMPHVLKMEPTAKSRFIKFHDQLVENMKCMDKHSKKFANKAKETVARLAIPLHGLRCLHDGREVSSKIDLITMESAVTVMKWALQEQLRVYGFANTKYKKKQTDTIKTALEKCANPKGVGTVRKVYRRQKITAEEAKEQVQELVDLGFCEWTTRKQNEYRLLTFRR